MLIDSVSFFYIFFYGISRRLDSQFDVQWRSRINIAVLQKLSEWSEVFVRRFEAVTLRGRTRSLRCDQWLRCLDAERNVSIERTGSCGLHMESGRVSCYQKVDGTCTSCVMAMANVISNYLFL